MNSNTSTDPPSAPLPFDPALLRHALEQARLEGKQLSRRIGEARKTGCDPAALLEQRKQLSVHERALSQRLALLEESLSPEPAVPALHAEHRLPSSAAPPPAEPVLVSPLEDSDCKAWDSFVREHPQASSYHLSGWRGVCHKAFGHTSHYLLARRSGQVVGVLPLVQLKSALFGNFLVSMPFLNYGGVLALDELARWQLQAHAVSLAERLGCSHIELRETSPGSWPMRTDKLSMWLPLPDTVEALWTQLGSKLRAQIKKGLNHGLVFETGGVVLLDDFYRVFSTNMRDLGTPVYSRRFFELVLREAPGQPELVVGKDATGKPVAAALVLRHGHRMEVPWASTLRRAHSTNANMALYWTLLSHACRQACRTFDFGRSSVDAPTHRFKKQWGAQAVPLFWHYWMADGHAIPQINPGNPKYQLAIAAWKRLPVMVANVVGPVISRSIP